MMLTLIEDEIIYIQRYILYSYKLADVEVLMCCRVLISFFERTGTCAFRDGKHLLHLLLRTAFTITNFGIYTNPNAYTLLTRAVSALHLHNPLYTLDFLLGCDDIRTAKEDGPSKLVVVSPSCTLNKNSRNLLKTRVIKSENLIIMK